MNIFLLVCIFLTSDYFLEYASYLGTGGGGNISIHLR